MLHFCIFIFHQRILWGNFTFWEPYKPDQYSHCIKRVSVYLCVKFVLQCIAITSTSFSKLRGKTQNILTFYFELFIMFNLSGSSCRRVQSYWESKIYYVQTKKGPKDNKIMIIMVADNHDYYHNALILFL